jgi:hypothetical protein
MKFSIVVLSVFLFWGCANEVSEENLKDLNGYWEIEKVIFPSGRTKEFKVNTTVDYFEVEGLKGFRKKVQPKFDGTFETSNDAELFTFTQVDSDFEFRYKNAENQWKERILEISENRFSVINTDTITYTYKRFEPININP